ncbi:MAG: metal ABC transporter permease [Bacteroidota bacterium]
MENPFTFLEIGNMNLLWVLIGIVCMSASSAVVGTFMFLQKRSLIGDTISHAILPGICLAFLITYTKETSVLLLGAVITGYLGLLCTNLIIRKSPLKSDAGLGIVLSVFYGVGILLLTIIQQSGNAAQSGLDKFLFGKAAALLPQDVWILGGSSCLIILLVVILFQPLSMLTFDREYAIAKGFPVGRLENFLSFLTVLAIAIGIQAIGVVLMSALLIAPAVAARYWTHTLWKLMLVAIGFAVLAGIAGVGISLRYAHMPTGPWVVVWLSVFAFLSILLGKEKGVIRRLIQQQKYRLKNLEENLLKALYQLGEGEPKGSILGFTPGEIQQRRYLSEKEIHRGVKRLSKKGLVTAEKGYINLSEQGLKIGERMVRIHRLWELYLTTHLNLPADHVHQNAEAIEHIITPEIEAALLESLEFPTRDPHQSPIPYPSNLP